MTDLPGHQSAALENPADWPVLNAPEAWHTVDFISDLHLQSSEPKTVQAWQRYLQETPADAVVMLGDLFEVWVGDDAADSGFEAHCAAVLRQASGNKALYFMRGNRDFLIGREFLAACGVTLLDDPTVLEFCSQRWLLTHGDALCLDDADYMAFRAEVRTARWQHAFLAKPLAERRAIARGLREGSELRKRSATTVYADVDAVAARQSLAAANASVMIHGHTHKPATHSLGDTMQRVVLSDWDAAANPPRLQVLRLTAAGLDRQDLR